MDNLIKQLIMYDRKAQETVGEALKEKEATQQSLAAEKQKIYDDYIARAKERMEKVKARTREIAEQDYQSALDNYRHALDGLNQTYKENREKWVEELVSRCLDEA